MAKLDTAPVRVNTPPLFARIPPVKVNTLPVQTEPEVVEEVKIFKKAALIDSNSSTTAFRLDESAVVQRVGGKLSEEEIDKFKTSPPLPQTLPSWQLLQEQLLQLGRQQQERQLHHRLEQSQVLQFPRQSVLQGSCQQARQQPCRPCHHQ